MVREERSDGTIAVTVAYGGQAGLRGRRRGASRASLGHGGLGLGGELTAAPVAASRSAATPGWCTTAAPPMRSWAPARVGRGARRRASRAGGSSRPTLRYGHGGLASGASSARPDRRAQDRSALSSQDVAGTRDRRRTGRRTYYVQRSVEGSLSLTQRGAGATGDA